MKNGPTAQPHFKSLSVTLTAAFFPLCAAVLLFLAFLNFYNALKHQSAALLA